MNRYVRIGECVVLLPLEVDMADDDVHHIPDDKVEVLEPTATLEQHVEAMTDAYRTTLSRRFKLPIERTKRPIGCKRLLTFPSKLATVRLEREAHDRGMTPDRLAALIIEILGRDELYGAILDR